MDIKTKKCEDCGKEVPYNEVQDKENNEVVQMKLRKTIVDLNNQKFPFYAVPKDKQQLVNPKFIKYLCIQCSLK